MRKVFLPLLFLFACYFSFGQAISVSADLNNILYLEIENPLKIVAENNSCGSLIVQINNGTITGKGCYYVCKPAFIGKATVTVSVKKNGKILDRVTVFEFRVKRLIDVPNVQAGIGPCHNNCEIAKDVLAAQEYVRGDIVNTDINANRPIDSFSVYIYSNCTSKIINKKGNRITDDLKQEFRSLQANDIVVFRNIYCTLLDNTIRELNPVMFFIKE